MWGLRLLRKARPFCKKSAAANHEISMRNKLNNVLRDEGGAVTVDWIVLTAAVVALAIVAFASLQSASGGVGVNLGNYLSTLPVSAGND